MEFLKSPAIVEFIRDPAWQFIGVLFALLAVVVSLWVFWRQQQVKRIHFAVERSANLLAIAEEVRHRIEVRYDDRTVSDLRVTEFSISNSGTIPIVPTDYVESMHFFFGQRAVVLSAEQISAVPHELAIQLSWHGNNSSIEDKTRVRLEPVLLNAGDSIGIRCLVTQSDECRPEARIMGVPTIHRRPDRDSTQ
jgi:hypothetical protein